MVINSANNVILYFAKGFILMALYIYGNPLIILPNSEYSMPIWK